MNYGSFIVAGQLVIDSDSDKIHSVELLARPKDTNRSIDIEKFFLEVDTEVLSEWFITQYHEAITFFQRTGIEPHINIDKRTLLEDFAGIYHYVSGNWDRSSLNHSNVPLTLEITQIHGLPQKSMIMAMRNHINDNLKIALDDYVFGVDSDMHLNSFAFDTIKVDRSVVLEAERSYQTAKKLMDLKTSLKCEFIIEGVETWSQVEMFKEMGFHLFQGYYFHVPEPLSDILKKLETNDLGYTRSSLSRELAKEYQKNVK